MTATNKAPLRDLLMALAGKVGLDRLTGREVALVRLSLERALGTTIGEVDAGLVDEVRTGLRPETRTTSFHLMVRQDESSRLLISLDLALTALKKPADRINNVCDTYIMALDVLRPLYGA